MASQVFTIKPLVWRCTSRRNIVSNNKPIVTETWETQSGTHDELHYKVYRSVGGRYFVEVPHFFREKISLTVIGSLRRQPCNSIDEGKGICGADYLNRMKELLVKA